MFSNWAQFLIVMNYLSLLTEEQTLVMYSGHPMGLFPSQPEAPRCIITNGMVSWIYVISRREKVHMMDNEKIFFRLYDVVTYRRKFLDVMDIISSVR